MEKPHKLRRLSYGELSVLPNLSTQSQASGHLLTEEDLCELIREASCEKENSDGVNGKHVFLRWLLGYLNRPDRNHLSASTYRQLHGWLILQLGCCVYDRNVNHRAKTERTMTRLLLSCLSLIYQSRSALTFLNPNELQEAIKAHMRQVIHSVQDFSKGENNDKSQKCEEEEEVLLIHDYCLHSIDVLFSTQVEGYGTIAAECCVPDEEFKDFLLAILWIQARCDCHQNDNKEKAVSHSSHFQATQHLLSKLCCTTASRNVDTISHWARIAASVADQYRYSDPTATTPQHSEIPHFAVFPVQNHRYRTQLEWLFEVECHIQLQQLTGFASEMEQTTNVLVVFGEQERTHLLRLALQEENMFLAARASRCLSHLSRRLKAIDLPTKSLRNTKEEAKPTHQSSFFLWFKTLLQVFVLATDPQIKIQVLAGLRECNDSRNGNSSRNLTTSLLVQTTNEGNNLGFELLPEPISLKVMVSTLVDLILTTPDGAVGWLALGSCGWRSDAAELLRDMIQDVLRFQEESVAPDSNDTDISQQDVISICLVFLESLYPEAVKCSVEILHWLLTVQSIEPFPAHQVSDLFRGLAAPLTSLNATVRCKQQVLDMLIWVSRQRSTHLSVLVRIPRALDGLVRCSSPRQGQPLPQDEHDPVLDDDDDDGSLPSSSVAQLQQSALTILLLLSRDASHHRILAKQTGLLAVLIRHVRDQEAAGTNAEWGPRGERQPQQQHLSLQSRFQDRQEIKANILLIAAAL